VSCGAEDTVARAYFEVPQGDGVDGDFFRLPFPNDFWRSPAGHLNLSTFPFPEEESEGGKPSHFVETYLQELEREVDGFSRSPVTYFRFSAPPSFASIKEEGAITYVNVTVGSPSFGQRIGPSWYVVQGRTSRYMCGNWLAVRPQLAGPLNAGDTYAVLLGGVITTVGGDSFERSTDMTAMLSATTPEDPELAAAYEAYAPLREWLVQTGTSADSVLNAAVFTVQSESDLVPQLRQVVRDQAVPTVSDLTLCDDGVESPCSQGEGERECATAHGSFAEIHGRISLPIFREGTAPYLRPVDGGDIARDVDGVPTVVRQEDVCFALTVPREAAPLPEGYPLVVYAHGTGGSFRSAIANGLAEDWATNQQDSSPWPVATLAIDLPQHGPRRGDSNLAPDGLFFNYSNPGAVRGNILQGTADLYSLLYWAQNLNWAAGESPTGEALQLAPDAIALFAHSQGATHAALALPWEPALQAVVLSGMGGNLTQSLLHKTNPLNIAGFLPIALRDADENGLLHGGSTHPALTVLQTYFDIVDPRNYAPLVHPDAGAGRPGRHLLMTYGLNDSYSPEKTQQAYAAAAGLPIVEPLLTVQLVDGEEVPNSFGLPTRPAPLGLNVPSGVPLWTTGLRQYQPNDGEDGHFVAFDTTAGRADTQQFLGQALAGEEPLIGP
jgi:hypothetical protein